MTNEILDVIEQCGLLALPVDETCQIAEISLDDFQTEPQAARRYRIGRLKAKFKLRETVMKAATSGDAQAIKTFTKYHADLDDAEWAKCQNL